MSAKKISTLLLTIFLVSTVIVMIFKIVEDNTGSTAVLDENLPNNVDVVYYFYTNIRCETCELLERYTGEAVKTNFAEELENGSLIWKTVNTDEDNNHHFLDDYELYTKSVVLVKIRNGKQESWKNLEEIWSIVDDEDEYKLYIKDEVVNFLETK